MNSPQTDAAGQPAHRNTTAPCRTCAHTDLPLVVTKEVDLDGYPKHTVRTEAGSPVAVLSNYCASEQKANAQLFATAHELLTVAKQASALLSRYPEHNDAWRAINAIVKKADGQA